MAKKIEIAWDDEAIDSLYYLLLRIEQDSIQNAGMIANSIIEKVESLRKHPGRFPRDRFKLNNQGNFRAFEVKGIRVSYSYSIR